MLGTSPRDHEAEVFATVACFKCLKRRTGRPNRDSITSVADGEHLKHETQRREEEIGAYERNGSL
jgi:hypothetical protein